jgi:hypothetical protein
MRIALLSLPPQNGLPGKCNAYSRKLSLDSIVISLDFNCYISLKFIRDYTSIISLEVSKYQGYEAQFDPGYQTAK